MFLRGWIIGWTIQLVAAAVLWLPLILISGWQGSWARAWATGATVRLWVWLGFWAILGGALLLGYAQNLAPSLTNRMASTTSGGASSAPSIVNAADPEIINVYDYTTTSAPFWTPIIMATVDEFNDVRPTTAPRLVYSAESGKFDCLDLPPRDANLAGIIICDTSRPEDFPYDPDAPKEGWAGSARQLDDDTTRIVLNNFVPEGYYQDADNTVCHEMMHAYTLVDDNYDSDVNSCVFGDRLSPGTTDVRLMKERWPLTVVEPTRPATVVEPPWPERVSDAILDVDIDIPGVNVGLPGDGPDRVPPAIEPTATPTRSIATAAPTASTRSGCDPAYPEDRTCIPPGPPLIEACAITDERKFTVLPPDPRGLDHDHDGIGCEPKPVAP